MIARIQLRFLVKASQDANVRKEIIELSEEVKFTFNRNRASNNWLVDIKIDTDNLSKLFYILKTNIHPKVVTTECLGTASIGTIKHSIVYHNSDIFLESPSLILEELI